MAALRAEERLLAAQWSAQSGASLSHGLAAVLLMAHALSDTSGLVFVQCTFGRDGAIYGAPLWEATG